MKRFDFTYSPAWNLFIITLGSVIFSVGVKAIATPHGFVPGGLFGLGSLTYYATKQLDPGMWFFILNMPIFIFAWLKVSRRFFLYSLYAMAIATAAYSLSPWVIHLNNETYAAMACGAITGLGGGIVLRSLGSNGGLDVIAIYLNRKFNLGIGRFYFVFNFVLFTCSAAFISADRIVGSLFLVFVASATVEYTLSLFSQRKVVFIISDKADVIAKGILDRLRLGATWLKGFGAYSGGEKNVLMTVIDNVRLKKLEELVFTEDENALFIVENTFNVLGSTFSKRKMY